MKQNEKVLNIFHLNIQSLRNKITSIEQYLDTLPAKTDVLTFSEHWLLPGEAQTMNIDGYQMANHFTRANHIHGGVITYVRKNVDYKVRNDITSFSIEGEYEFSAIQISNCVIVTCYRPPKGCVQSFINVIDNICQKINFNSTDIIFIGDFNIKFNSCNQYDLDFKNCLTSHGLKSIITEKTHHVNCIDNVILKVKALNAEKNTFVESPNLSDHKAIGINILLSDNKNIRFTRKKCRPVTEQGIFDFFQMVDKLDFYFVKSKDLSIEEKFTLLVNNLQQCALDAFPEKTYVTRNSNITWFNYKLHKMREHINLLNDLCKQFNLQIFREQLKEARRAYKFEIQKNKKNSNSKYIRNSGNTCKAMWDVINNIRNVNNKKESVNVSVKKLNEYFTNVAKKITSDLPKNSNVSFVKPNVNVNFKFNNVSFSDVRLAFKSLKSKSSRDYFGLSSRILKSIKEILIIPLTHLINECINKGVYPDILKISKVIPIFKKGCKSDPSNYRPISLVPVISKIVEIVLKNQICNHFEKFSLFSSTQFGFRSGKSTTSAILNLIDKIVDGMEDGEFVSAILCDLSKAFDCVSPDMLLNKLDWYKFDSLSKNLIASYLKNRKQVVCINEEQSELRSVIHGVPQGSVLGPLLFLIFINDFSMNVTDTDVVLYADDATLISANSDFDQLKLDMQDAQSNASTWFNNNNLLLNKEKTNKIVFTTRKYNDQNMSKNVKYLGVHLDTLLTFEVHVNETATKISKNLFLLRNMKNIVEGNVLRTAYDSLIKSHLSYAILCWGHSPHHKTLFGLQRKAVRILSNVGFRDDVRPSFISLGLLTLPCIYILNCIMYTHNNLQLHKQNFDFHNYDTRDKEKIRTKYLRISKCRNVNNYYGPLFYNKVPNEIQNSTDIELKKYVIQFLTENAFYTYNEFLEKSWTLTPT